MPPRVRHLVVVTLTASVVALVLCLGVDSSHPLGERPTPLVLVVLEALRGACCLALLSAGVLLLVRSLRTGRTPLALVAAALVAAAVCTPLLPPGGGALVHLARHGPNLLVHLTGVALAAGLLWRATGAHQVEAGCRPVSGVVRSAGVGACVQVVAVALAVAGVAPVAAVTAGLLHVAAAAVWATVCWRLLTGCGGLDRDVAVPAAWWAAHGTASGLLLAVAAVAGPPWSQHLAVVALTLQVSGAVSLLAVGVRGLRLVLAHDAALERRMLGRVRVSEVMTHRHLERLHDARAAVAGIRCAQEVLAGAVQRLDPAARDELERSARSELARLERVLATSAGTRAGGPGTDVDDVVRPLVALVRERRVRVRWAPSGEHALMGADDLATVVSALLDNARTHAPGATVDVRTVSRAGVVEVHVTDDGPGVPAALRDQVFDLGASRPGSPGRGIGLAHARRLAREAGGDLALVAGSTFVLSVPAPASGASRRSSRDRVRGT